MRYVVVAIAGLAVIVIAGMYTGGYLAETSGLLLDHVAQVQRLVQAQDWEGAQQQFAEIASYWDRHKGRWEMFIDHSEVDDVDVIVGRVGQALAARDQVRLQLELESLLRRLGHIPEKYNFKWQNIL